MDVSWSEGEQGEQLFDQNLAEVAPLATVELKNEHLRGRSAWVTGHDRHELREAGLIGKAQSRQNCADRQTQ